MFTQHKQTQMKKVLFVMALLFGGFLLSAAPPAYAQAADTGTQDTGTEDTGTEDTGDTGSSGGGTVTAGPAEEVIHKSPDGKTTDVTNNPNDAFPAGSQVPNQQQSTAAPSTEESQERPYTFQKVKGTVQRRYFKK